MQAEIIEGYRLSPQQEHLWLIQQPEVAPFRSQCVVRIEGNLERKTVREALSQVIQRHEILRTAFRYLREMSAPLQVITEAHISWGPDYELKNLGPEEKDERLGLLLQAER